MYIWVQKPAHAAALCQIIVTNMVAIRPPVILVLGPEACVRSSCAWTSSRSLQSPVTLENYPPAPLSNKSAPRVPPADQQPLWIRNRGVSGCQECHPSTLHCNDNFSLSGEKPKTEALFKNAISVSFSGVEIRKRMSRFSLCLKCENFHWVQHLLCGNLCEIF